MELRLVVVSGRTNKGAITLRPPIVIGRSRQAELTVAHPMISRRHCEIFEVDGLAMIRDLGSLNGTMVEGKRVRESPLRPGREFSLGPLTFRAEYQYQGDLDSLPAAKIADQEAPRPPFGPDRPASADEADEQTPRSRRVDPPAPGQRPALDPWDQVATEEVGDAGDAEAMAEIGEPPGAEDEEKSEVESTAPLPRHPTQEAASDGIQPTEAAAQDDPDDSLRPDCP